MNVSRQIRSAIVAAIVTAAAAQPIGSASTAPDPQAALFESIRINPEDVAATDELRAALAERADFEFQNVPLHEVVDRLRKKFRIQIELSDETLRDLHLDRALPITFSARGIRLRNALRFLVEGTGLHIHPSGGILHLGYLPVPKGAFGEQERWYTRIYPVADLISGPPRGSRADPTSVLLDAAIAQLPENWTCFDDAATPVFKYEPTTLSLVVCVPPVIHERIERVFAGLRASQGRLKRILAAARLD